MAISSPSVSTQPKTIKTGLIAALAWGLLLCSTTARADTPKHAAFSKIPSYLDRVRAGDWAIYKVVLEQSGAKPQTVQLKTRIQRLTEQRCTLHVERSTPGEKSSVTSQNHLPRLKTWRELWHKMMREKGMNVRLSASSVSRDQLLFGQRKIPCTRVTLTYAGTFALRGQTVPMTGRTTYWLSRAFPIQGIGKSISRFTLSQANKKTSYQVLLTLEKSGRGGPKK